MNAAGELAGYAADRGVTLAIEPTSWLYADLTFIHTFHDALLVAPRAGMGICLDAFHVWTEAGLREEIGEHASLIAHVQLSDMTRGSRALPCRAVPGDGDVPLAAVVRWLLDAGYPGVFDCELNGPAIDAIGHHAAAAQAANWLDKLLADHDPGAPGQPCGPMVGATIRSWADGCASDTVPGQVQTAAPEPGKAGGLLDERQRAPPDDIDQQPGVDTPLGGLLQAGGDVLLHERADPGGERRHVACPSAARWLAELPPLMCSSALSS